jgi:hypothetical protein
MEEIAEMVSGRELAFGALPGRPRCTCDAMKLGGWAND